MANRDINELFQWLDRPIFWDPVPELAPRVAGRPRPHPALPQGPRGAAGGAADPARHAHEQDRRQDEDAGLGMPAVTLGSPRNRFLGRGEPRWGRDHRVPGSGEPRDGLPRAEPRAHRHPVELLEVRDPAAADRRRVRPGRPAAGGVLADLPVLPAAVPRRAGAARRRHRQPLHHRRPLPEPLPRRGAPNFPELDSVVRYEGEETLVELVDRIAAGEDWRDIPGIACARDGEVVAQHRRGARPGPRQPALAAAPTPPSTCSASRRCPCWRAAAAPGAVPSARSTPSTARAPGKVVRVRGRIRWSRRCE